MDNQKLKNNLIGTAKMYRYGLAILIPMIAVDGYKSGLEDVMFFLGLVIGFVPVLAVKVLLYTYVEQLSFHKISKGVLWSFLSAIVLVSSIFCLSYVEPPALSFSEMRLYVSIFTVLLFLNYFMLPWKES